MRERPPPPPPRPTGPLPTRGAGFGSRDAGLLEVVDRRTHLGCVPRRPASRQGNPGTPARRPRTTAATADASEPYRSHRARKRIVVSTDGSVSSCRMPVSGSSACISGSGPASQGPPLCSSQAARLLPGLPCPGSAGCASGRAVSSRKPHHPASGGGPSRAASPATPGSRAHPAIRLEPRQATPRRPRRRTAAALRVPATVLFRHHRNRSRRRSRAPSSIQPCENASRVTGDVAAPSARRTAFAAEHPARSAPPYRGPPRRRQSRPTRAVHPSGPPPAAHSGPAAFLFFMTAGFAGASR